MSQQKRILALMLTAALTACGGGGDDIGSSSSDNTGSTGGSSGGGVISGGGTGADTGGVSTNTNIKNPRLGSGTGSGYKSAMEIAVPNLSAGGTTKVSAVIVDADSNNGKIITQSYKVVINSVCAGADPARAVLSKSEVTTQSGEVSVSYTAKGCVGKDQITMQLFNTSGDNTAIAAHTLIGTVDVSPAEVGSIVYAQASTSTISIATIANPVLPTFTDVTFKVLDKSGNPIVDKKVDFKLTNTQGGISLLAGSATTDEQGEVKATVNAGSTHAVTSVHATTLALDGTTKLTTSSQPISVSTGIARQDRFSISVDKFNPAAFLKDGEVVNVTVHSSDAFGNPTPNGTIVNFMAEFGSVSSSCALSEGACSVVWKSSGAREFKSALGIPSDGAGMTTIMAYTLGEAGFSDQNSNYILDSGESFMTYPEPFLDTNFDGIRTATELFVDTNFDSNYNSAPTVYQGMLCSTGMKGVGHCASEMHVRGDIRIVQSLENSVGVRIFQCATTTSCTEKQLDTFTLGSDGKFYVVLQDANSNMPASGTTLAVSGTGYKTFGNQGEVDNNIGEIGMPGLITLGVKYGAVYEVSYTDASAATANTDTIELTATSGKSKVVVILTRA